MRQENQSRNDEHRLHSPLESIPKAMVVGKLFKNKRIKLIMMIVGIIALLLLLWWSLFDAELRQYILSPLAIYVLFQGTDKFFPRRNEDKKKE